MQMRISNQWWWNSSFENLMGNLEEWLAQNPGIQIVHMDWKFITEEKRWYMIVLYKPPG